MPERNPRHRTGTPELDAHIWALLATAGIPRDHENADQLFEIMATVVRLGRDGAERLDLKITNGALREMRSAFKMFAPYRPIPKVTIFGSARTRPDDPLYAQTRSLAASLAERGWMVITGAGPGIMAAGLEGAGRDRSFGVNIRLPFEQGANEFIASDPKLVEMKYFFTRKLMFIKESDGFVVLPGGFGTLDEAYELFTLIQTGKAEPAPVVLLDVPGGTYWHGWERFLREQVASVGLINPEDTALFRITDDVDVACEEILGFYRNYHSRRYVAGRMVIRLHHAPAGGDLMRLSETFGDILLSGGIEAVPVSKPELADDDHVDLARVTMHFDRMSHGRLRTLIDALNALAPYPDPDPEIPPERHRTQ